MTSNSISVSVNFNAALDTAESNYLPLQNLCFRAFKKDPGSVFPASQEGMWPDTIAHQNINLSAFQLQDAAFTLAEKPPSPTNATCQILL